MRGKPKVTRHCEGEVSKWRLLKGRERMCGRVKEICKTGRVTEEREGGWVEKDECNTCGEGGGRRCKKKSKIECETDYADHNQNYVLHINKHHISFAVIFKVFFLQLYRVSI